MKKIIAFLLSGLMIFTCVFSSVITAGARIDFGEIPLDDFEDGLVPCYNKTRITTTVSGYGGMTNENGKFRISLYSGDDIDPVVPAYLDEYEVEEIWGTFDPYGYQNPWEEAVYFGAFEEQSYLHDRKIKSVVLPSTLKTIGTSAFYNCTELRDVIVYSPDAVIYDKRFCPYSWGERNFQDPFGSCTDLTFYGYSGSDVEVYAQANGFDFVPIDNIGNDVNGDESVNVNDVTDIQKNVALLIDFSTVQKISADINRDGIVNIIDATALQKILARLFEE